jgi:drug/metabolite transporter (DMT)-like permease
MFWILPALFAAFSEATKDYVSKRTMRHASPWGASFALLVFTLPFLFIALLFAGIPEIGPMFLPAILANSTVYVVAVIIYMRALEASPLSLTLPMIAFTPAFMLLTGPIVLGEFPKLLGLIGILTVVAGAYVLKAGHVRKGILAPFRALLAERGPRLMLLVAFIFSVTGVALKVAVNESSPMFAGVVGYSITAAIMVPFVLLAKKVRPREIRKNWAGFVGIGFFMALSEIGLLYAYTMTLAVYTVAVKRFSVLIGSAYGFAFFKEKEIVPRLAGSSLMLLGVVLMAL